MKFSIKDFFSICDKIGRKLNGKLHSLCSAGHVKEQLTENQVRAKKNFAR